MAGLTHLCYCEPTGISVLLTKDSILGDFLNDCIELLVVGCLTVAVYIIIAVVAVRGNVSVVVSILVSAFVVFFVLIVAELVIRAGVRSGGRIRLLLGLLSKDNDNCLLKETC